MQKMIILAGAAGLAALVASAAPAQQAMPRPGAHPDPLGAATIARADAQARAAAMFAQMDLNKDGKLDAADRAARIAQHFDTMDTNRDGALSRQEFAAAHERMHAAGGAAREHHGMKMHHHGQAGARPGRMDTNGDHALTRDEFIAGALQRFDRADVNHDGKVTPEERRAAFRHGMMQRRHGHGGMSGHDEGAGHDGGADHAMGATPPPPTK